MVISNPLLSEVLNPIANVFLILIRTGAQIHLIPKQAF